MQRGDIVWVDFDPSKGHEQKKRRPAILVSNPAAIATVIHRHGGMVTVVPLTSNVARVF